MIVYVFTKNNIDTFLLHLRAYLGSYLSYTGFLWFNYFFMKNYVEIIRLLEPMRLVSFVWVLRLNWT